MRFLVLSILYLLQSCASPVVEDMKGIIDEKYTQVRVYPFINGQPIKIELLFSPNLYSIPSEANTNKYIVSFTIKQSNFGTPAYYENITAFISLTNSSTLQNPIYHFAGILYKNCEEPCNSIITGLENENGEDLITDYISPSIIRNTTDGFFHMITYIDPSHKGENWQAIHGFPFIDRGVPQIIYPFYRVLFQLAR